MKGNKQSTDGVSGFDHNPDEKTPLLTVPKLGGNGWERLARTIQADSLLPTKE
jgi:hypothetical protein